MTDFTNFVKPAPHPGEFLREDYLPQYGLTAGALAKAMGLSDRTRIEKLVREQIGVSADTALRLARVFGTSPGLWTNLQASHDLSKAAIKSKTALAELQKLQPTGMSEEAAVYRPQERKAVRRPARRRKAGR